MRAQERPERREPARRRVLPRVAEAPAPADVRADAEVPRDAVEAAASRVLPDKALFASLDLNDDGKVDSIEWGKGLSKNQTLLKKYFGRGTATGARPMKELGAMFKKLDTNQDGFLSFDEMVAAARGLPPAGAAAPDEPPDEIDEEGYF